MNKNWAKINVCIIDAISKIELQTLLELTFSQSAHTFASTRRLFVSSSSSYAGVSHWARDALQFFMYKKNIVIKDKQRINCKITREKQWYFKAASCEVKSGKILRAWVDEASLTCNHLHDWLLIAACKSHESCKIMPLLCTQTDWKLYYEKKNFD